MHVALRGVPRHLRASVHGDLLEQQGDVRDAIAIALHFQLEPYRAGVDFRAALWLLCAAAGVLLIVPVAAQGLLAQAAVFDGAFGRTALLLWSAPKVVAAAACGLIIGRASVLPKHADAVRLHLVLVLAPAAALLAPDSVQAVLAAGLLAAAAWLGFQNRPVSTGEAEQV